MSKSHKKDRRSFLKQVGISGAGLALGSQFQSLASAQAESSSSYPAWTLQSSPEFVDAVKQTLADRGITQVRVGITPPALSEYYDLIFHGAQAQMQEYDELFGLKWEFQISGPREHEAIEAQLQTIQTWSRQEFDAVLVCTAADVTSMDDLFGEVAEAGTAPYFFNMPNRYLFMLPDSPLSPFESNMRSSIGYDNMGAHANVARYFANLLTLKYGEPRGTVAMVWGLPGHWSAAREAGFREGLAEYPDIQIVGKAQGDYVRDRGLAAAENLLEANPDVDILYGENEEMGLGAAQAARSRGLELWNWDTNTGVIALGADGLVSGFEEIKNGTFTATLDVNPVMNGMRMIEAVFWDRVLGWDIDPIINIPTNIADIKNVNLHEAMGRWALTNDYGG